MPDEDRFTYDEFSHELCHCGGGGPECNDRYAAEEIYEIYLEELPEFSSEYLPEKEK